MVVVWTLPDREMLYKEFPFVTIRTDLPHELLSPSLVRNSFLYNDGPPIEKMLHKCRINTNDIIHGWKGTEWKSDACYKDKLIFEPLKPTDESNEEYFKLKYKADLRSRGNILLMPRFKVGATYSEKRNWGMKNWKELSSLMLDKLGHNLIFCGKYGESYYISSPRERTLNLISRDPLNLVISALYDFNTFLCVGSQSFNVKLALLQNVDTIMWGHQKQRHQIDENWSSNGKTECMFLETKDYKISPYIIFDSIMKYLEK